MSAESTTYLTQADMVGQGIDIFGTYRLPQSILSYVLDAESAPTKTFSLLGTDYTVPAYVVAVESTSSEVVEDSVETRDDYQNSLAATAEAKADIGAFSGQMSVSYSSEYASSSDYSYAYRNFYLGYATLGIDIDEALNYRTQTFLDSIEALPETAGADNLSAFEEFFDKYGYYYAYQVSLGGTLEYSVAVSTSSEQSTEDIAANVKVEYKSLFDSGSVSATYSSSDSWQTYQANRNVIISMLGGDPVAISEVVALAEGDPSADSVAAYDTWVNSVATALAATSFKVAEIWDLAPERAGALEAAWDLISTGLRPEMKIEAPYRNGDKPTIILGVPIIPTEAAEYNSGFQVVILDRTNPTASGVVYNKYYSAERNDDSEYDEFGAIWQQMVDDVTNGGYLDPKYFFILATFYFSGDAPPLQQPPEYTAYSFLLSCGAGDDLVTWVNGSWPGSDIADSEAEYVLAGVAGLSAEGAESISFESTTLRQIVYFYPQSDSSYYTLSDGGTYGDTTTAPEPKKSTRRVTKTKRTNEFIVVN
ncbi:MAG TPA: MAC/perforin domain-containing protein [Thermoanaerobaculia bacterium]|nr:MAC/perforin domain-containing protein [Thermoanaerobaculia bacterium]